MKICDTHFSGMMKQEANPYKRRLNVVAVFLNRAKQNLGGLIFTIEILSLFVDKCILWQLEDTFMGESNHTQ